MPSPRGRGALRPYSLRSLAMSVGVSYAIAESLVAQGRIPAGAQSPEDVVVALAVTRLPRRRPGQEVEDDVVQLIRKNLPSMTAGTVMVVTADSARLFASVLDAVPSMGSTDEAVTLLPVGAWKFRAGVAPREGARLAG